MAKAGHWGNLRRQGDFWLRHKSGDLLLRQSVIKNGYGDIRVCHYDHFFVWEKCEPYPLAADAFDKTRTIALARGIELRVPVGKDSRHPEKPEIR